ncbi:MAG TPA: parallel beta-helix domain-containing protein [Myxococcota bacterium]|jgi:parallel beta-helix repeat protein|nr:parallel beta-helix domain-containing protein [Myxococcota bacterium]
MTRRPPSQRLLLLLLASACTAAVPLAAGCGPRDDCTAHFKSGEDDQASIQGALIGAQPGDTYCFDEGAFTFTDELSVSVNDVTLRGAGAAVTTLDFSGQIAGGNGVSSTADGFTIEAMTVKNTPGDAIRVTGATGVTFRGVTVSWDAGSITDNGAYGLYPVTCVNVLIEDCEVVGASDAGIYVGQSSNIIVRNSRAHGNVAGIEIENSTDAEVYDNEAYDNTGGILVFNLPNLPIGDGARTSVHDNQVYMNNRPNFALAGAIVALVPVGLGILVMANDDTEIWANDIHDNDGSGFLVVSYSTLEALGGSPANDPAFDPYVEGCWVHDNTFTSNGAMPTGALTLLMQPTLEDMLWDGTVSDPMTVTPADVLCLSANGSATFRNFDMPGVFANQSTDATVHDCTRTPLPPVVF